MYIHTHTFVHTKYVVTYIYYMMRVKYRYTGVCVHRFFIMTTCWFSPQLSTFALLCTYS